MTRGNMFKLSLPVPSSDNSNCYLIVHLMVVYLYLMHNITDIVIRDEILIIMFYGLNYSCYKLYLLQMLRSIN